MKDRLLTIALSVAATYGLMKAESQGSKELDVDRLIVRKELVVSDTGSPWEKGYEAHQIPAESTLDRWGTVSAGYNQLLIEGEIDDPFDDHFTRSTRAACAARRGISHGMSGLMEHGARWRSSKARDLSFPRYRDSSGTAKRIQGGFASRRSGRDMASRSPMR